MTLVNTQWVLNVMTFFITLYFFVSKPFVKIDFMLVLFLTKSILKFDFFLKCDISVIQN